MAPPQRDDAAGHTRHTPRTLVPALPGLRMLRTYPRGWLRQDAFVGAAVAAYLIPQVLAYSGLVGVPAVVGLWGAVAAMAVYWLFGSSRVLAIGPESTVALMAGSVVAQLSDGDPQRAIALSAGLALVVAGWLLLAWLLRLGVVADLLSHPLLVGYLSGGAVLMVVGQLGRVTGIEVDGTSVVDQLRSFASQVGTGAGNLPTFLVALGTLAILFGVAAWRRTAPAPLIAMVAAIVASSVLGLAERGVAVLGAVPQGLPSPTLPALSWSDVSALALAGLGVAVVAYSDNTLIGRAFARRGEPFDANQELLALSAVHVGVGVMSAYPVSSSGTRTALAVSGGARSQVYSIVAMLVVVLVLLFAGPLIQDLPDAALGAVVIFAARSLVSIPDYRELWRYRPSEFALALVTLVGTVWLGILAGVGIAVVLSLLEMTSRMSRPHDAIQGFVPDMAGMHDVDDYPDAWTIPGLVVYRYDAPLFFANAENFRALVLAAVDEYDTPQQPVRWVVLNVEANMHVDATAIRLLVGLVDELRSRGIRVGLARAKHDLLLQLERSDLLDLIGREMVFPTLPTAVEAFRAWAAAHPEPDRPRPPGGPVDPSGSA
ncbi:MAG: SulP family inorganic anion transporter [Candidatus Nanopelagicales bacterium]|jgi:SulP family sulfate permease|nr:SulP family inorganic anion transporter [Candidatus Nanopelagicales bacterium]